MTAKVDLNDVAVFADVVRAGSFTAAAAQRGVPVSTVSRHVARLETGLATRLLERTTRKLQLTDVGRRYFGHAERALAELFEGGEYVRSSSTVPRGPVRITAPIGLGPLLADILAPYLVAHPDVTLEIDLTERRVDLLAEGIDIAVRTGPSDTLDLVARQIFSATRALFASKAYLARRGRPKRIADLATHDLVTMRSSASGAVWDLFHNRRRHRITFKPRLVVNEMIAARQAILAGAGIGMLASISLGDARLERVLPRVSGETGGMWVLYPAHRALTAAVRSCTEHLIQTLPMHH
jgi:DNA-binding transcriptional LysR family regulator